MPEYSTRGFGALVDLNEMALESKGSLITFDSSNKPVGLNVGTDGQILVSSGGLPQWKSPSERNLILGLTPTQSGTWTGINYLTDNDLVNPCSVNWSGAQTKTLKFDLGAQKMIFNIGMAHYLNVTGGNVTAKIEYSNDDNTYGAISDFNIDQSNLSMQNAIKRYSILQPIRYFKVTVTGTGGSSGTYQLFELFVS